MSTIRGWEIPQKERSKIIHEINDLYYAKYKGSPLIAHRSVGLDNGYYIYLLENIRFNDYIFLMRFDNLDDERCGDDNERI